MCSCAVVEYSYMNRPDRPSLSRAVALHCVRSRLKIMLFSWGHLRITTLSTKTGPGNNSKRSYRYTNTFSKVNKNDVLLLLSIHDKFLARYVLSDLYYGSR